MFRKFTGDWTRLRGPDVVELDLHGRGEREGHFAIMARTYDQVLSALIDARANGARALLILHGWSTSRPGKTTKRSVVRGFMRSKEATPHILKSTCVQHDSAFFAVLKQH